MPFAIWQFPTRRPFPIGPGEHGGLQAVLAHIVGAMRRWADRIGARPVRAPIESWRAGWEERDPFTPDELLTLLAAAHDDLASVIAEARRGGDAGLSRDVVLSPPGAPNPHTFTAGACIASVLAHGHYHRAQCMNILRQFGVSAESIDVIDWQEAEE